MTEEAPTETKTQDRQELTNQFFDQLNTAVQNAFANGLTMIDVHGGLSLLKAALDEDFVRMTEGRLNEEAEQRADS